MKLRSNIRFVDEKIKKAFYELENGDPKDRELFKNINQAMNAIVENAFCGVQIPKYLIPKDYVKKYKVKNIWKYNLPDGWRLIYSIVNDKVIVISLILEWFDHKEYERRFKY